MLRMLVSGQTYTEMAEVLIVSTNTIKTQVSSIYRKLGVSRRAEAIAVHSAVAPPLAESPPNRWPGRPGSLLHLDELHSVILQQPRCLLGKPASLGFARHLLRNHPPNHEHW